MDPSLLRERDAFRKKAMAQPAVEKKRPKPGSMSGRPPPKKKKPAWATAGQGQSNSSSLSGSAYNYKMMQGSSKYKFGVLAKIVNHMKTRHQQGDTFPLSIDEILDETSQLDVGSKQKMWLMNEALPNNPKIAMEDGGYVFKPPYHLRGRKDLLRLLNRHDQQGLGGIMWDDIVESLPNAEKSIKLLGDRVIIITRPDKKKVLFYNDKAFQLPIDEEFKELWHSSTVESLDEGKIEEYLRKQGITSMQDLSSKKFTPHQKKRPVRKGPRKFKKHNDHLATVLKDYSEDTNK
ncbi:general transcription factor IIE subunit 2-like [Amphiura filiformis]|uniref:general transcription factor IIE subunit 2-like n=1 Tax=Amphiura filiformis TaxID=82378 RepID=UPI003B225DD5